jgi:enoyl-CoA hydratase / 3-hydroxyacyl-CoA dehydrogenase
MVNHEIKKVCFVGAGTMGCYNSLLSGIAGYDTVVYDISEEALKRVPQGQEMIGNFLMAIGTFDAERVTEGRNRIRFETNPEAAARDADLVSESVFENLDLKRRIHSQFDEICPPEAILTTNTSYIMVPEIEDIVRRGDRFAAMHFYLLAPLVDVVGGPRTSPVTMDILNRFVRSLECIPFTPAREKRGYVHNNLLPGLNYAATALVSQYGERFMDIDRAWVAIQQATIGPFALMDLVGIDVYYNAVKGSFLNRGETRPARMLIDLLQPYMDRGELGMKTGKGFYTYPNPAYASPGFLAESEPREDIHRVLANGVIIRAVQLAEEGIADFTDIDRVWMINMKSISGPFAWLDKKGLDVFLTEIESEGRDFLFPEYDRDQVRRFLDPFIKKGQTGISSGKGFYAYPNPVYEAADFLVNPFQPGP